MSYAQQLLQPLPGLEVPAGHPCRAHLKGQGRNTLPVPCATKPTCLLAGSWGCRSHHPGFCPSHISAAWYTSSSLRAPEEQVSGQEENTFSLAHTHPHLSPHARMHGRTCTDTHTYSYADIHTHTHTLYPEESELHQSLTSFWGQLRALVTKTQGPHARSKTTMEPYSDVHVLCRPVPLQA